MEQQDQDPGQQQQQLQTAGGEQAGSVVLRFTMKMSKDAAAIHVSATGQITVVRQL